MKKLILSLVAIFAITNFAFSQAGENQKPLPQPKLMALPMAEEKKDPITLYNTDKNVQAAYTAINKVLADRKLEIVDLNQAIANIDKMRAMNPNFDNDPNAFIAANSGADVYLEYSIEIIKEGPTYKAAVNLNVKESATAKLLGSGRGTSKALSTADISSLASMAINNCIEEIMQQIRAYWIETPKNGKPIKVSISSSSVDLNQPTPNGKRIDRELTKFLKEKTIVYNRDISTAKNLIFNPVYVDIYKYSDISDFKDELEDLFQTFGLKYNSEVFGKEILIKLDQ
jgi:hypothetical protein